MSSIGENLTDEEQVQAIVGRAQDALELIAQDNSHLDAASEALWNNNDGPPDFSHEKISRIDEARAQFASLLSSVKILINQGKVNADDLPEDLKNALKHHAAVNVVKVLN